MLRTVIIAAALVAVSSNASAHGGYIREVIRTEPSISVAIGSVRHDGFRVEFESGGHVYNTIRERHPSRYIVVPQPVAVVPVVVPRPYARDDYWRDDRRHWRDEHRHWRGKHHRHGRGHQHDD
jgi:hypothetical protein